MAGCIPVVMVSKNRKHLQAIEKLARAEISAKDFGLVTFIQPDEIATLLDSYLAIPKTNTEMIKGFRVVTEFQDEKKDIVKGIKSRLSSIFKRKK
jgi:hypothetical protein